MALYTIQSIVEAVAHYDLTSKASSKGGQAGSGTLNAPNL